MRRALVVLVCLLGALNACRPPQPQRIVEANCYRQCEQIYWSCKAGCPQDIGGSLGCVMAACNPARDNCMATCPTVGWTQPQGASGVAQELAPQGIQPGSGFDPTKPCHGWKDCDEPNDAPSEDMRQEYREACTRDCLKLTDHNAFNECSVRYMGYK